MSSSSVDKDQLQLRLMALAGEAPAGASPDPAETRLRPPELVQDPPERQRPKWFSGAYVLAPRSIVESDLPSMAKLVYLALASYATGAGAAWPSIRALSKRASCDRRTTLRSLRVLVDAGWVSRRPRPVVDNRHDTTLYALSDGGRK